MSDADPDKLKVAELREELKARGLDTKGNKAALVARLKAALDTSENQAGTREATTESFGNEEEEAEEQKKDAGEEEECAHDDDEDVQLLDEEICEEEETPAQASAAAGQGTNTKQEQQENGNMEDEEEAIILGDEFRTIDEAKPDDPEGNTDRKRKRSRSRERHGRSRSRDRHDGGRRHIRVSPPPRKIEMEDASWETQTVFTLDRFDADLSLRINDRGIKAHPLTVNGFAYMWSGVRTNYGVRSSKVAYEVKVLEYLNVDHLPSEELDPNGIRVGWSVNSSSLHLGEEQLSYGYGSNGKCCTEGNYVDYGQKFAVGDVITCYLDFEEDAVVVSFSKNAEDLGKCFEIEKAKLGENALFPHIVTKNAEFECNFGGREGPYFSLKDGFKFLEEIPPQERIRGHLPPKSKEDCEVIITVGLPGAGKSYWAQKHMQANPDKCYNLLGTSSIIDQMRVMGKPRKQNHAGKWEVLAERANKCLTRYIELAARKKRNYIIDQTNVYASSRRRKMQLFEGFHRKAVVVFPTDEVFKLRLKERAEEEAKDIPESAVNEMKANLSLPEDGEHFQSIEYVEEGLSKEEREKLVEQYRIEGRDALPPPEKRPRPESREYSDRRRGSSYRDDRPRSGYRGNNWKPVHERRGGYRSDRYYDDSYGYKGSRGGYGSYRGSYRGGYGSRGGYRHSDWDSYDDDWDNYGPSYRDRWSGHSRTWSSYR